ncbi:MAG TPA: lytic transglycosylase domain-containing protein [Bryobacteraceae bacterium]|nr:lytic transglycosylase domain-containing protein [Bryobacteraceae bacterium]
MFNGINGLRSLCLVLGLAAHMPAAEPAAAVAKAMHQSISKQRQAVASMAVSLQAQRHSLQTQLAHLPGPPPSTQAEPPLLPLPPAIPSLPAPETPVCPPLPAAELDSLVQNAAVQEGVEPDLIRGVIRQESAARPCAVSSKGAMGLMQLMPATAFQFGVADAFDPKQNVNAGARLLKQLLTMYGGDVSLALGAFNAGPGKVSVAGGLPDYPETIEYVQKVLSLIPEPQ